MKFILLAACIVGVAVCAPLQAYKEFDIYFAPAEASKVIPAGVPATALDVLLPVDDQLMIVAGLGRGFVKQEVLLPNGIDKKDVYIPFGWEGPCPAPVVPVAPVAPLAPVVDAAPAAPAADAAPAAPAADAAAAPVAKASSDDEEDD